MANSAYPDQLASSEANWSGSTLFAKQGKSVFSRIGVKCKFDNHEYIQTYDPPSLIMQDS